MPSKYSIVAAVLCFTGVTNAREGTDLSSLSLSDLLKMKVSIASKNEESQLHSASSVTLFTSGDIQRLGIQTLPELLNLVPGFYSMMNSVEGNQSHLITRGHAQKYASTLLILLNGQRINDDYTGGINYLMRFISLNNVEKVEVIRGPGSALYGSNAYSGVVNIITNFDSRVLLAAGNLDSTSLFASHQLEFENWQLGGAANVYRDNGYHFNGVFDRNGLQTTTTDPRDVENISLRLNDKRNQINFNYLHSNRQNYYLFRRLRDNVTEIDLKHWALYSKHRLVTDEIWNLELSMGYQFATRKSVTALAVAGEPPFDSADFLFGESFEYQSTNFNFDGSYILSNSQTLNFGIAYLESQVPDAYLRSNYDIFGDLNYLGELMTFETNEVVLDKVRRLTSGYFQTQWKATPQINITFGLRYDGYNDVDNALTPRFSLVFEKSDNEIFKLIYGEAYRAPSLGDLYDEESGLTIGNQSLKASELESIELVYSYFNQNFSVTTTLFDNHHENLIGFRADGGSVFLDNVAANRAQGVELEWRWQINELFRVDTAMTHLFKNKTDLGLALDLPASEEIAPRSYANFSFIFNQAEWDISVSGNWRSKVKVLQNSESILLANAHITYHLSRDTNLSFRVSNLTNKSYETSSYVVLGTNNDGVDVQEYPARGRHWMLQFEYRFD